MTNTNNTESNISFLIIGGEVKENDRQFLLDTVQGLGYTAAFSGLELPETNAISANSTMAERPEAPKKFFKFSDITDSRDVVYIEHFDNLSTLHSPQMQRQYFHLAYNKIMHNSRIRLYTGSWHSTSYIQDKDPIPLPHVQIVERTEPYHGPTIHNKGPRMIAERYGFIAGSLIEWADKEGVESLGKRSKTISAVDMAVCTLRDQLLAKSE